MSDCKPENLMAFLESAGQGCLTGDIKNYPQLVPACKWAAERMKRLQRIELTLNDTVDLVRLLMKELTR